MMEAERTKTHLPNSKPQAHFPSSAADWTARSEQMLVFAHLWTLLRACVGRRESEVSTGKCLRETAGLLIGRLWGWCYRGLCVYTKCPPETLSTYFSEEGSRRRSTAELSFHSLMTQALAKTTSIHSLWASACVSAKPHAIWKWLWGTRALGEWASKLHPPKAQPPQLITLSALKVF